MRKVGSGRAASLLTPILRYRGPRGAEVAERDGAAHEPTHKAMNLSSVRSNRDAGGGFTLKSPRDSHVNSDDHPVRSVTGSFFVNRVLEFIY